MNERATQEPRNSGEDVPFWRARAVAWQDLENHVHREDASRTAVD
jgi:hypothetical protein